MKLTHVYIMNINNSLTFYQLKRMELANTQSEYSETVTQTHSKVNNSRPVRNMFLTATSFCVQYIEL